MHKLQKNESRISENRKEYEFTFSIIMAVYNVEEYVKEAIESVINQTYDFKDVQIILVNDGSPDRSDLICKEYAKLYPNNIVYIEQENSGVSVTRNKGIEEAKGKYLNFMDPDDKLSEGALEHVYNFFMDNENVKIATIPLKFFEATEGEHQLNYKFTEQKVVNVYEDYTKIFQSSGASFIHREAIGEKRFPINKKFGEDSELLLSIVMENKEFGLIPEAIYHYRKRFADNSALQRSYEDFDYFIPYLKDILKILESYSANEDRQVPRYVQFVAMYDLQWRLRLKELPEVLIGFEDEYFNLVYKILAYIYNDIIHKQKHLNWYQKHALISYKNTGKLPGERNHYYMLENIGDTDLYLIDRNGTRLYKLSDALLNIDIFDYAEGQLRISGCLSHLFPQESMGIHLELSNGEQIQGKQLEYKNDDAFITGRLIHEHFGFEIIVDKEQLRDSEELKFYVTYEGVTKLVRLKFRGQSTKIAQENKYSYLVIEDRMLRYNRSTRAVEIVPYTMKMMLSQEWKYRNELGRQKIGNRNQISLIRSYIRLKKKFQKNKINLFMDRVNKADDSAEVLYEYFESQKNQNEENYFIVDKKSSDYQRLKDKGFNVIGYKTRKHKLLLLLADTLISTHADKFIYQPVGKADKYYKDLKNYQFIFLQHGITKDDMSAWLKKSDKNFRMFITASKYEYDSIINGNYQFTEREVKLTGFPRFDKLVNSTKEKNILIMPTWRKGIVSEYSNKLNARPYSEKFKESLFFKRWNGVLTNQRLLEAAKKNGYNIIFVPHPSIRQQMEDFSITDIQVADYSERYVDLFNKGRLLITDYSSVYFDFAYTKKPVTYYHFDSGNWDNENGYFSYEKMGFGPIYQDEGPLVDYLIQKMEENCEMDQAYIERVDDFFAYTDQKNCERVYNEIQKL